MFPSPDYGLRYDLFHRFLPLAFPFFEIYRQREGWGTALFQSVITHYNTFIHTGCKVPWVLRRLSRGGVRSLRRPLLTKAKMSATFLVVSPSASSRFAKLTLADGGSENRIFHCPSTVLFAKSRGHKNSPNGRNVLFLSRAFYALLLRTYVPAMGFTRPAAIPPECPPVRTYTANLRKTHLYEVVQWLPLP